MRHTENVKSLFEQKYIRVAQNWRWLSTHGQELGETDRESAETKLEVTDGLQLTAWLFVTGGPQVLIL